MIKTICRSVGRILSIWLLMAAFAATAWAQQLTLNIKQGTLEQVLKQINAQTGYKFTYTDAINAKGTIINVKVTNTDPLAFFKTFFKENSIDYRISDKQVYLSPAKKSDSRQSSQPITVKGKVTDETGEPLVGVYVKDESSNAITSTDIDGIYTITVPGTESKLNYSMVGMKDKTIDVNGRGTIDVIMENQLDELEEIVVVGYGVQKK